MDQKQQVEFQRKYYNETAQAYDNLHVTKFDEHERALRILFSWIPVLAIRSIIDVGAGTGRVQRIAKTQGLIAALSVLSRSKRSEKSDMRRGLRKMS